MDLIFLRTRNWDDFDGAHRSAQLARAALAHGHHVLYVEFQPSYKRARPPHLTLVDCTQLGFNRVALHRAWLGLEPNVGPEFEARFSERLDCFETPQSERIA